MNRSRKYLVALLLTAIILPVAMAATFKITGGAITLSSGCVTDDSVASGAAISADKIRHIYKAGTNFDLAVGGTPATKEQLVFVGSTAGVIRGFHFMLADTGTSTSIAWDLKKNGVTVLSGAGSSTHSDTDGQVKDGTLSATVFAADDRFTIAMTVSSATGAQGPYAWGDFEENAP